MSKVEELDKKIDTFEKEIRETNAITCRIRILRFGDEVRMGVKHSQENFDNVLADIRSYKQYCDEHSEFENDKTVMTTQVILDNYRKRLEKNDFL